jgi:hypothetical protein
MAQSTAAPEALVAASNKPKRVKPAGKKKAKRPAKKSGSGS